MVEKQRGEWRTIVYECPIIGQGCPKSGHPCLIPFLNRGSGEIMREDFPVRISFGSHHGGSDLAKPYAMSPSGSRQDEAGGDIKADILLIDNKGRAV